MVNYCLKLAALLITIFSLPIFVFRALPYDDRAGHVLIQQNCPTPCFMGIRPGVTTMREAVYILQSHAWVANGAEGFSALVRSAVFYDAAIPRTVIDWRWSEAVPDWIDRTRQGNVIVEDREVLDMIIQSHLLLGEIILAFGDPDASWFVTSNSSSGGQFEYYAWYGSVGMLVKTEGECPTLHHYELPVWITFRLGSQTPFQSDTQAFICR